MSRRIDHDKVTRRLRGEAADKPEHGARKDSARVLSRSRPSVDEMFADVQEARARRAAKDAPHGADDER